MEAERLYAYWQRKGHASRLLEHYYEAFHPQTHPIPSRAYFLQGIATLRQRYPDKDTVPVPETLQGIYLVPMEIDVWHGSEDRLHDRYLCTRTEAGWTSSVVVP
jgi:pyridoxamine 5'-phosphate oxidase